MPIEQLKQLWALAFGDSPELIDSFFSTGFHPDRCRFLGEGEQAAAALYWLDGELAGSRYAYIYAVATHPDYRGRGLCRRLMEMTHADLRKEGYAGALLKPGEAGLWEMYEKMGYRGGTRITEFFCGAGKTGVPIRRIDTDEYARLRREYLPGGGLLQEGESLAYLASYAKFYAGEDYVLAAVRQKRNLFVPELLGNPHRAPQILKALDCRSGTFRTPGEELPFAMYLPLREDAPAPAYLGLAFD